jgi:multiple sugar transport system permease protein
VSPGDPDSFAANYIDGTPGDSRVALAQPALATVAVFSFLTHWNDFFHPLIYLSTVENFPLSVGLRWFQQTANDQSEPREHLLMAASILMVLPCVLIFFTMQRYFVRGIVMSGIKG